MAKSINISYAPVPGFPVGSAVSAIQVNVTDPTGAVTPLLATPDQASVAFDATVIGDYSVAVQAVDANGVVLGAAVSASFSVAAPATVTLSIPSAVSIVDAA